MMKGLFLFFIGIFSTCGLQSQVYFDAQFHKLNNKNGASFYKITDSTDNEIVVKTYFINDTINSISHFKNSKIRERQGKNYQYYQSGKLKYDIDYENGKLNGFLLGYFENGQKRRVDFYKNDSLIEGKCYTTNGLDTVYYIHEHSASYKGQNLEGFRRFVLSKLRYPAKAARKGIKGRVILEFCVNSKGYVVDIVVIKSPDDLLSQSAINALKESDIWTPGIQEGMNVKQKFTIPIDFKLEK